MGILLTDDGVRAVISHCATLWRERENSDLIRIYAAGEDLSCLLVAIFHDHEVYSWGLVTALFVSTRSARPARQTDGLAVLKSERAGRQTV